MSTNTDEDEIEASRAPLLDHLMELRSRLVVACTALVIGFVGCFIFVDPIFQFLAEPFRVARDAAHPQLAGQPIELINTGAFGFFSVKMQIALFAAIVVMFPIIAWQVYAFIAPGLYKRERAAAAPFLISAPMMFLAGASFVYFVAMPFALKFAFDQEVTQGELHVKYLPKVEEYMGLVTTLVVAFGLMFQMPVVLSLLARVGMISADMLRKGRRFAVVGIAGFAALVTPNDLFSMAMMAVPIYLLYEISIWLVAAIRSDQAKRDAADEAALKPGAAE